MKKVVFIALLALAGFAGYTLLGNKNSGNAVSNNATNNVNGVAATQAAAGGEKAALRAQIRAVGSSTVYPFTTVVAETFADKTGLKNPIIESTGTGGGFKLFCSGVGKNTPDLSNASRAIKDSEIELCAKNGVNNPIEINIGYDGIVLANSVKGKQFNLTKEEIFNALAKDIPVDGEFKPNTNKTWADINPALPNIAIEVYGPPPTSGTRDAFVELVMESGCKQYAAFKEAYPNKKERKKICHLMREDNAFIEAGENDNLIIQKLTANPNALGIFGYSFLDQNSESVQGSIIGGVEPNFDAISSGSYKVSRPLFVYAKKEHLSQVEGLAAFVQELVSEDAVGEEGYLTYKGLIPLGGSKLDAIRKAVNNNL